MKKIFILLIFISYNFTEEDEKAGFEKSFTNSLQSLFYMIKFVLKNLNTYVYGAVAIIMFLLVSYIFSWIEDIKKKSIKNQGILYLPGRKLCSLEDVNYQINQIENYNYSI